MEMERRGKGLDRSRESTTSRQTDVISRGGQNRPEKRETNILQRRTVGSFGSVCLLVNEIIGSGIFATPKPIYRLAGSVGMTLVLWALGCVISICGSFVFLEFGLAIPRSGGMKNYLERAFKPRLLQLCMYTFFCMFLQTSSSSAITFSAYFLVAVRGEYGTWARKSVAVGAIAFCCLVHAVLPRHGRYLANILAVVKLFVVTFMICCGFAALAGNSHPGTGAFDDAFEGTSTNGFNIGKALLYVTFSICGYDNACAILSEVRNPQRTLKTALPVALGLISILYMLTNIAYFAILEPQDFSAGITVAVPLFRNMFGTTYAASILPGLVALSTLGHMLSVTFAAPRMIQELAKDGMLPFSDFMMENRPCKSPVPGLLWHLAISAFFICAPPMGELFELMVSLATYPTTLMYLLVTIGLVKLRLSREEKWEPPFSAPWATTVFFMAGNIFMLVMPCVPPPPHMGDTTRLPYWLSSVIPLLILLLGIVYYLLRFVILPRFFGYRLEEARTQLSDGSAVTRYKAVPRT